MPHNRRDNGLVQRVLYFDPEAIASADRVIALAAGGVSHDLRSVSGSGSVQKAH